MDTVVKHVIPLLALFACGSPPATVIPASAPSHVSPACPTCPACPACPPASPTPDCTACVKPPTSTALSNDWHCMDARLSTGDNTVFCYATATVCANKRAEVIAKKLGTPSECTPHRTAYCTEITDAKAMGRQLLCARTLEQCESRRKDILENKPVANDATACKLRHNTDTFERNRPDAD